MAESAAVLKSASDERDYRALQLPNGLRVLLIHDPEIDVTADDPAPERPRHPGEEDVITDDDDENSIMSGEEGSSGSEAEDEDDSDAASMSSGEGGAKEKPSGSHVKKSAAAMSVGVGFFSDPVHLQGLSHYLEHMLFMGSSKYPDENDYDAFLSAQGGSSNACTEEEATTFYFDCRPAALRPALDRFAQFFVAPLIKSDALDREVQAVDQEFTGVMQSDSCRLQGLRSHTARTGHVASKFGWGNKTSLVEQPAAAGTDVRSELLQHYKQQYSAERMNLIVLGGEALDTLQEWVLELFQDVPGGRGPRPRYDSEGPPFGGGQFYVLPAVRGEHKLSALFQLPSLDHEYTKKAEDYVSHLLGHEGRGSLLAGLKLRGWATDLCASVSEHTSAACLFELTITLTDAGLAAGPGCGLAPSGLLFQYLNMLRAAGPQRWVWDEMAAIAEMKFRFLEEDDAASYVEQLASDMHRFPPHHAVAGDYVHEEYDPQLISQLLGLMTPSAVRLDLQTHTFEACQASAAAAMAPSTLASGQEPWFGFPFVHAALPGELIDAWSSAAPSQDVQLPPRNNYIPSDFALKCEVEGAVVEEAVANDEAAAANGVSTEQGVAAAAAAADDVSAFPSAPLLLLDQPGLRLWHKLDAAFRLPLANAYFRLASPAAYASPRAAAMTHLVMKLLEDSLCEEAYLADVAGLHYSLWFEGQQGIDIKVEGFSHKALLLIPLIFRTLAALHFSDETFSRVREALVRVYRNAKTKPLKHATYLRLRALRRHLYESDDVCIELENLQPADVRAFLPMLLADTHLEALIFGNVTAEEAHAGAESARAALGSCGSGVPGDCTLQLPAGRCLLHRAAAHNSDEDNSVVEIYLQCGAAADAAARAVLDMADQLVYEPCYDTLRTKEQLGYTVHSGTRLTHGVVGFCVVVQSGVHGPAHLEARVEAFLESFGQRLQGMEEAEFEQNRTSLLASKLMKDRNMAEESERGWDAIVNGARDFDARRNEVAALRTLTLAQVKEFFCAALAPVAAGRCKLAVHVAGRGHLEELQAGPPTTATEIVEDLDGLKERLTFFPPVAAAAKAGAS